MASARSLALLALVPAAAAVPVIAASSSSQWRRTARLVGFGQAASSPGSAAGGCRPLQHRSKALPGCAISSSSSLVPAGRASLLFLAGPSANSAMAVSEERSGNAAVVDEEKNVTESNGATFPDLMTEFMVNMSCEGCVKSVRNRLEPLQGVKSVDIDLPNQVVRILGSAPSRDLTSAIAQTGRDVRLIGQGLPSNFAISAAVAEFKGPEINGVVRFSQVSMELARIDASFSGLTSGSHAWSINSYGDLTRGAASTGGVYESDCPHSASSNDKPMGDLGVLDVNAKGETDYSGTKAGLQVSELIGRAIVLYPSTDMSKVGITAAVIARSAGVGENYKKLCSCDGTVIWEATNNDFVKL